MMTGDDYGDDNDGDDGDDGDDDGDGDNGDDGDDDGEEHPEHHREGNPGAGLPAPLTTRRSQTHPSLTALS